MRPKKNQYFLGGQVRGMADRVNQFREDRPGAANALGGLSGMGMVNALRERMKAKREMENGGIMKYRTGGMIYADQGDILQTEKDKNGTSGPSSLGDLFSTLEAVEIPEDYTEQEFIDVRGTARMGDQEVEKAAGGALDREKPQPLEFRVRKYGGRAPQLRDMEFELEDIQLGGVDEETGELIPNAITLPAYVFDMIEDGAIERKDIIQALGQSYSRSDERGRRAVPQIIRGAEPEEEERTTPPRPRGGKTRQLPQIRFPQIGYKTSPKYAGGPRPVFKKGQLGRIGRGG